MRERRRVGPAEFTRLLLTRGERAEVPLPLERRRVGEGGASRVPWMAEALKRDALGWLFRAGGWQRRGVVVGGRRREGRVTDAGIFERLDVRFTPASLRLVVAAMEDPLLPVVAGPLVLALEQGTGSAAPATGDLLALHRVASALVRDTSGIPRDVPAEALLPALRQLRLAVPGCSRAWVVTQDGALMAEDADAPEDPAWAAALEQALGPGRAPEEPAGWVRAAPTLFLRALGAGRAWVACAVEPRTAGLRAGLDGQPATTAVAQLARVVGKGTPRAVVEARRRDLVRASPLTRLFSPEELGSWPEGGGDEARVAAAAKRLAPLFAGDRAVLFTYLDRALARAWLDEEADRRRRDGPEAMSRYASAGRGLAAFARAALAAERADALRPLARFYQGYALRFGNRAPIVEALRERAKAFDRASERDAFLATCACLFGGCRFIVAAVERTLGTAVIDRAEEDKALLADWHDGLRAVADEMEAIRRELAGEIG